MNTEGLDRWDSEEKLLCSRIEFVLSDAMGRIELLHQQIDCLREDKPEGYIELEFGALSQIDAIRQDCQQKQDALMVKLARLRAERTAAFKEQNQQEDEGDTDEEDTDEEDFWDTDEE